MGYRIILETEVLEFGFRPKGGNYHVVATLDAEPTGEEVEMYVREWEDRTSREDRAAAARRAATPEAEGDEWEVERYCRVVVLAPGALTPDEEMEMEMRDYARLLEIRKQQEIAAREQREREEREAQQDLLEHEAHGERLRWEGKR